MRFAMFASMLALSVPGAAQVQPPVIPVVPVIVPVMPFLTQTHRKRHQYVPAPSDVPRQIRPHLPELDDDLQTTIETVSGDPFPYPQYEMISARLKELIRDCRPKPLRSQYLDCLSEGIMRAYGRGEFGPNVRVMTMRARPAQ